jgi:hypothetical protein
MNFQLNTKAPATGGEAQTRADTLVTASPGETHQNASNHERFSFAEYIELVYTAVSSEIDLLLSGGESWDFPVSTLLLHKLVEQQKEGKLPEIRSYCELLGVALWCFTENPEELTFQHTNAVEFLWEGFESANSKRKAA